MYIVVLIVHITTANSVGLLPVIYILPFLFHFTETIHKFSCFTIISICAKIYNVPSSDSYDEIWNRGYEILLRHDVYVIFKKICTQLVYITSSLGGTIV